MINMIRADIYRMSKNIGMYIAFGIMLFMILISVFIVSPGQIGSVNTNATNASSSNVMENITMEEMSNMNISDLRELMLSQEGYELDRDMLANNINLYYVLIFIAAIAITIDFSSGSVKNTLSSAISRNRYYISKSVTVTLLCILYVILNTYLGYALNNIINGGRVTAGIGALTKITLMQIPPVIALAGVLTGIAFAVKKTSVFNIITIPLILVIQLVLSIVSQIFNISGEFMSYEFQSMFAMLANEPSSGYMVKSYIVCAVLTVSFNIFGYIMFRKAEIK